MRNPSIAVVALGALAVASPVAAADLPVKAPPPPAVVVAPYSWTGFYIGANIGGSFGQADNDLFFAGVPVASQSPNLDGVVGGGQIGYNWQTGSWVWGIEADIQGTSEQGSADPSETIVRIGTGSLPYTDKLPWFGTVRGRLGFTPADRWLLYVTGGLAYGEVEADTTFTHGATSIINNFSSTRAGWTVGGGVEASLGGNWTGKIEYLFIDLGSFNNTFTTVAPFTPVTLNSHVTDNIVRVGVNYRFH